MYRLHIIILVTITLLCPHAAMAGEEVYFALFARGWPPYEIADESGTSGIAVDIFRAVMPEDVTPVIEPGNKPRSRLSLGQNTHMYTRLEAKEWMPGKRWLIWSDPVIRLDDVLISPAAAPIDYDGPSSLEGKTVGCIRNYHYPTIQSLFTRHKATRYDVNSDIILLRMVEAGRVDAAVLDRRTAYWLIRNSDSVELCDLHIAENPVDSVDLAFAFRPGIGWEEMLPDINQRIKAIRQDGTLERILNKYQ